MTPKETSDSGFELDPGKTLSPQFYSRKATQVAKDLLGKILFHRIGRIVLAGRIIEAEAYLGQEDPCSHAFRGPTPRARIMFGPPGRAYVYLIYGNHFCLNVVAHNGGAGAVLIRALEPLFGIAKMMQRRKTKNPILLTNGPGKLTQAFGITKAHNGLDVSSGKFLILDAPQPQELILKSPRVGISTATNKPYRFSLENNPYVSRPIPRRSSSAANLE